MQQDTLANNKRIAKNTLFLYFRMILILVVSLYTSRVVLRELGVVDFGVYNVVGGIVLMFSFLNSSMSTATQRFLTFELGKGDFYRLKSTFSASLNIHIVLGGIIFIFAETIGLWFVNEKLVIPPERLFAANVVYQCSILSFFINITQVPYNASLIAHEKMDIYAYLSIFEVVGKLCVAIVLVRYGDDKLIIFAFLVLLIHVILLFLYRAYCIFNYKECRLSLFWDKNLYKEITSFASWNIFGSIAWLFKGQGLNILLNLFFGPAINAARGLSYQISGTLSGFVSNFTLALNPQITKHYAQGKIQEMELLSYVGLKFSYMLLFLFVFPILLNVEYIMTLWLGNVPSYTSIFVTLVLIDELINSIFGSPLMTSLMATGNIKRYQIVVSICIMQIFPLAYIVFFLGSHPESVFYIMIMISLLSGVIRLHFCVKQLGYSYDHFVEVTFRPVLKVTLLSIPLPLFFKFCLFTHNNFVNHFFIFMSSLFIIIGCIYSVGLTHKEKTLLLNKIASKFRE